MIDINDKDDFTQAAASVVAALQRQLGVGYLVFSYFDSQHAKGLGIVPSIGTERRKSLERQPLQLRLRWPDSAWSEFIHGNDQSQQWHAEAFAANFMDRLAALEAWYEFHLRSSSQTLGEPIEIAFEVVGAGLIPSLDENVV